MASRDGLAQDSDINDDEVTDVSSVIGLGEVTSKIDLLALNKSELKESSVATESMRDLFQSVSLFSGFPEPLFQQIKGAVSIVVAEPDTEILKQGEYNANLYFLILGNVEVFVDGGLVATLRRKGDLLGEMSVITKKPCAATIVAKTPVEMICLNTDEFRRMSGQNTDQFDHILYRIYSMILTDKLNITNQKAKRLAETMDTLERTKAELQDMNQQLERKVAERTQSIQAKLQELHTSHLKNLRETLAISANAVDVATRPTIMKGLIEVEAVIRFLQPIVQRFNLEVSMKSKHVLLAQGERRAQTVAKTALGGTGVNIEIVQNVDEATEKLKEQKMDVVLVDSASLDLITRMDKIKQPPQFTYVATESIAENIPRLMQIPLVPNILFMREQDRATVVRTIMTAVTKLCSPSIFGFEKYLNVGVEVRELPITHSDDRAVLIKKMQEHFSKLGVRSSVLDRVGTVLEEMLMNAIYDAPTDDKGAPIYNRLQRTEKVNLLPNQQGAFSFATDGASIAISVEDPFGALSGTTILKYLDSCYNNRAGEFQVDKGGAGRGLHQIVENSSLVVFNVAPKRRTEVIALFDLVAAEKTEKGSQLHYFSQV